ncbi:hypothetical protein DPMN_060083 [Dreissena polymorpha]|uniref:Uncharacterized protein n=1 Tax=Dreissena polymorpha TaxID=45954 RepID=A0A9D4C578_DREPO|nr:hypothetical protein DPMN_060083 [Dreissena polymorpha]
MRHWLRRELHENYVVLPTIPEANIALAREYLDIVAGNSYGIYCDSITIALKQSFMQTCGARMEVVDVVMARLFSICINLITYDH